MSISSIFIAVAVARNVDMMTMIATVKDDHDVDVNISIIRRIGGA